MQTVQINLAESGILLLLKHACEEKQLAAMLAIKMLAGVAPEVNLMERISRMPLSSVNKAVHSGFEILWRRHQRAKVGVYIKGHVSTKIFKK